MKKMSKMELQVRNREIQDRLAELNDKAVEENRAFSADEQREWDSLSREKTMNQGLLKDMLTDRELAALNEKNSKDAQFREYLRDLRQNKGEREILLRPATGNTTANIEASGAINLTINDMIPTLTEGLDLPVGVQIVTGVTGNEIWPVSVNDVELEEVGEVATLNDQVLDFAQISATPRRVGATVPISNAAIDNAAFDLMAFVSEKFAKATRLYLAQKLYSQAAYTGNKGPFGGLTAAGTLTIGATTYKDILSAVAQFSNEGFFDGNVCISMDRVTEAELKATPKIAGAAGGFVIENGLCAGYPYTVSHFVNTELDQQGKLVPTTDKFLEIGYWEWFAVQQHGDVRLTIDATSQAVAKKNITAVTLNSFWSMTDLSTHINGGNPSGSTYPTTAFAKYKVV